MTLYRYSEDLISMKTTSSARVYSILSGFIGGVILVIGILFWNHTAVRPFMFRSEYALAGENALLRLSVRELTYSLEGLDDQFQQLSRHDDGLSLLLRQPLTSADSLARFRYFAQHTEH